MFKQPSLSFNPPSPWVQGVLLLTFTSISWGGLLQIAKPLLTTLDPFVLNSIRYAICAPILAMILVHREGRSSLSFEGNFLRLTLLGTVGFAGFGIVALLGVQRTRPEHASLIVAMMPLITALVGWLLGLGRPSRFATGCMLLGFSGVVLTASQGNLKNLVTGDVGYAALLVLIGVSCWALYTLSATSLPSWSTLRYTTLSCLASLPGFALILMVASLLGWTNLPQGENLMDTLWRMTYIIVIATILAILAWNTGIRQLGPLNGVLFINLVPISAFTIGILTGQHFSEAEWVGAFLVIFSLLASNIFARKKGNNKSERAVLSEQ